MARESAGGSDPGLTGAPGTFDACYREQWAAMVRLAWLMTGSRELAEDVVQDAFVQVNLRWSSIDTPVAYLRVAVVNGTRAHARRVSRGRAVLDEPVQPVLPPELDETWQLLTQLSARQREALVLRFYADLSFEQIAGVLQCRLGTAKSLVHRGLARLKELMER
jgi:RNA polymerase sigma factor (sigma-70 family)